MNKQPEALRLADVLIGSPQFSGTPIWQAAAMLRKQSTAIKQLREALTFVSRYTNAKPAAEHAQAALSATEEFQK